MDRKIQRIKGKSMSRKSRFDEEFQKKTVKLSLKSKTILKNAGL